MAKSMQVVIEADAANFVANMNKVDAQFKDTAREANLATSSLQGFAAGFDTLTGKAIPGLSGISASFGAAKQISESLGKTWDLLKTKDFTTRVIAGMTGVTTSTVAADGATKALTASTVAYQTVATLGIAAAVYGITQVVSSIYKEIEATKELQEEQKKLRESQRQYDIDQAKGRAEEMRNLVESQKTTEEKTLETENKFKDAIKDRIALESKYKEINARIREERNRGTGDSIAGLIASRNEMSAEMSGASVSELQIAYKRFQDEQIKKRNDQIAKERELSKQQFDANEKINKSKLDNIQKIIDLTMTSEEKIARDREQQYQAIATALAEGNASAEDLQIFSKFREKERQDNLIKPLEPYLESIKTSSQREEEAINKFREAADKAIGTAGEIGDAQRQEIEKKIRGDFRAPTLAEQSGGLSAMSRGSLAAYQTLNQQNTTHTLLQQMIANQKAQMKVNQEQVDEQKKTNETLQA